MANGGLFGDIPPPADPGPSLEALQAIIETKVRYLNLRKRRVSKWKIAWDVMKSARHLSSQAPGLPHILQNIEFCN